MTEDAPPPDEIEQATEEIERDLEAAGEFFITLKERALTLYERLADQLGSESALYQAAAIAAALLLGWPLGRPLRASIDRLLHGEHVPWVQVLHDPCFLPNPLPFTLPRTPILLISRQRCGC